MGNMLYFESPRTDVEILELLQKRKRVEFSRDDFQKAAEGRVAVLLQTCPFFSLAQQEWLWAVYYSYQRRAPKTSGSVLEKVAFLLSFREDYLALDMLLEDHPILLIQEGKNIPCHPLVFYARHGHLEKVQAFFKGSLSDIVIHEALLESFLNKHSGVQSFLREMLAASIVIPRLALDRLSPRSETYRYRF